MVPRLWPGSTLICLGAGPSTTPEDLARTEGQHVIAVNSMYTLAPWAEVLYAADDKWWQWHKGAPDFAGLKFTVSPLVGELYPDVTVLRTLGPTGLSDQPDAISLGDHSGYQAINVAILLGAARILLLGYDMQPSANGRHHLHPEHDDGRHPAYEPWCWNYRQMLPQLADWGIAVINCSRQTAIDAFPRMTLEDALGLG